MKLLSLFDGSGGFPLAAVQCGITPIMASEVEPYPIAVTTSRFPQMRHLGDISKINGSQIEPVHIITFGSPCQDLSVAGKQAGLKHETNGDSETTRSGLFMEAVRIIKEMRRATHGKYPKFAVWENVPGAFSSNKGEDFRTVLEELIKISEPEAPPLPMPEKGKWPYADVILGDGWSLAYRTFDAQYWGVPQRRRRIYLVADFTGQRAGKVLFEREGLHRNPPQSGTERQEAHRHAQGRAGATDRASTYIIDQIGGQGEYWSDGHISSTLRAGGQGAVVIPIHDMATRYSGKRGVNTDGKGNGLGVGKSGDSMYTLTQGDRHAVAGLGCEQVSHTLIARMSSAVGTTQDHLIVTENRPPRYIVRRLTPTECARLQGFHDTWGHPNHKETLSDEEYRFWLDVRNTHATINGRAAKEYTRAQMLTWYNKLHTDSSEYKMYGNGVALPNVLYVMQGIADALKGQQNAEKKI